MRGFHSGRNNAEPRAVPLDDTVRPPHGNGSEERPRALVASLAQLLAERVAMRRLVTPRILMYDQAKSAGCEPHRATLPILRSVCSAFPRMPNKPRRAKVMASKRKG
jgi:hypothetical protein